jgi:molybdopterin molybdotransferase
MDAFYHAPRPENRRDNHLISVTTLITIGEARERVLGAVSPLPEEQVEIAHALDRVLARDVEAAGDVPPFPCSAMDGYAVRAAEAGRTLPVVGESRAGAPAATELRPGEAIRISTGAAVPAGADAVIRQEDVEELGEKIRVQAPVASGQNIRGAGEDLRRGASVLTAGTTLRVGELGVATAAGAATLAVARRPRVAILSTGDELRAPGEPLGPGEIHNSNAVMLAALARRCGGVALEPVRLRDDLDATRAGLAGALESADVVVVSGGVSVGPHDHVKPALADLAVPEVFWGVALQPGKPTWFGARDDRLVFGLPGNPVSAVVTFALFVRPALAALQGATAKSRHSAKAKLGTAVRRNPAREQAIRVRLEDRDGRLVAQPNGPQGSHIVSSLVGADALALIPRGEGELAPGTQVELEELPL